MKKRILFLLLLLTALLAAGCSKAPSGTNAPLGRDTPLLTKVQAAAPDAGDLVPLTAEDLTDVLGIEPEAYTEFVYLQESGMGGREILVLRAADKDALALVVRQMESYLEQRRDETRNYAPEAYQLLSKAKVETQDLTAALFSGEKAAEESKAVLAGE